MLIISMSPVILFTIYLLWKRSKYKNRKNAGAFFYENDCLVLNTGIPYPIPIDEIELVKLKYSPWELEHLFSYTLVIQVFKKNGKKKTVFYKGYKTAHYRTPEDMIESFKERKIPYETKTN